MSTLRNNPPSATTATALPPADAAHPHPDFHDVAITIANGDLGRAVAISYAMAAARDAERARCLAWMDTAFSAVMMAGVPRAPVVVARERIRNGDDFPGNGVIAGARSAGVVRGDHASEDLPDPLRHIENGRARG